MFMIPFHEKFPEIAEKETRCVILTENKHLPAGEYFLLESYCDDLKCDCRRVFINVQHNGKIAATIGYGLESLEFHKKWIGDDDLAKDVKGPILEFGCVYTKYAPALLKLFKDIVLKDEIFIELLKRHYAIFKQKR